MADRAKRLQANVAGEYYVDGECIDCDLCRNALPEVFRRDDDAGLSVVHRQPATPAEIRRAEEAREICPTDSIGNDG